MGRAKYDAENAVSMKAILLVPFFINTNSENSPILYSNTVAYISMLQSLSPYFSLCSLDYKNICT